MKKRIIGFLVVISAISVFFAVQVGGSVDEENEKQDIQTTASLSVDRIPGPVTLLLIGSGLLGIAGFGRRKFTKRDAAKGI